MFNRQFKHDVKDIQSIKDICKTSYENIAKAFGYSTNWKNLNKFLILKAEIINEVKKRREIIIEK